MLLTISTTHRPATDLGYLLHKHPGRVQSFDLSFGRAVVFYPEATEERCTAALALDVDPVGLVRGKGGPGSSGGLDQYVNDRPYVATSFLSVAIAQVFGTALSGICKTHEALAANSIPLKATIPAVHCRAGAEILRELFEPLGYTVQVTAHPLDVAIFPGESSHTYSLELEGTVRLSDLLSHLYVLIPVLDNDKHYWVGDDEVAKLLRHGEGWLTQHPKREYITSRYLKFQKNLIDAAMEKLREDDPPSDVSDDVADPVEERIERQLSLHEQRHGTVISVLKSHNARSVVDLGCGEGRLIRELIRDPSFTRIAGTDVSHRVLQIAADRLRLDRMPSMQRDRIQLFQGSLMYRDERIKGFDAAAVVEVIEHLDEPRLAAFERVVFEFARPKLVVITTPNCEYNVRWETLPAGHMRHRDHRFEWTRAQFRDWAEGVASRFGYTVKYLPIGPDDPEVGSPTQMGVFATGGAT